MKIVYIAHCISGNQQANLKDLARIIRIINLNSKDICPVAPYYADLVALNDNVPKERQRGIENNTELIKSGVFKELWLTGPKISDGMKAEINLFNSLKIPIYNYINLL